MTVLIRRRLRKAVVIIVLLFVFGYGLNQIPAWWILPSAPRYYRDSCNMPDTTGGFLAEVRREQARKQRRWFHKLIPR